jgi:hypothetical protein
MKQAATAWHFSNAQSPDARRGFAVQQTARQQSCNQMRLQAASTEA